LQKKEYIMSKGSKRRPEDKKKIDKNWDKVFGNKSNKDEKQKSK